MRGSGRDGHNGQTDPSAPSESPHDPLRPNREAQLLALAADGLTDKQIAAELGISMGTVDTYWRRIRARYQATSRTEAVASALKLHAAHAMTLMTLEQERLLHEMQDHAHVEDELRQHLAELRLKVGDKTEQLERAVDQLWRARVMLANLGAVLWWADAKPPWTIEWISDSVAQWGYEAPKLAKNTSFLELLHEDDIVAFEAGILVALRTPTRPFEREYRLMTKSGEPRRVRERFACVSSEPHKEPRLTGIQMDLSAA